MPVFIADSSSSRVPKSLSVVVCVGPQKVHFIVPRRVLSSKLLDLESLLDEDDEEKPEPTLYLDRDEPETVALLIRWMLVGSSILHNMEQNILSMAPTANDEEALGDGCHLFFDLYCLCSRLNVVMNGDEVIEKIGNLVRHGYRSPLQPRTVRMVLKELDEHSTVLEQVLEEVANDLVKHIGHNYDYYAELLEGPDAIPGLVRTLFKLMKEPRSLGLP